MKKKKKLAQGASHDISSGHPFPFILFVSVIAA